MKATIEQFMEQYNKEYNFLYEHNNVAGQDEAQQWFDDNQSKPEVKEYVKAYIEYEGDFISSDREAQAFAFTCEVLDIG